MSKNHLYSTPQSSPNFNSSVELSSRRKQKEAKKVPDNAQQEGQEKENDERTIENGSSSTSDSDSGGVFVQNPFFRSDIKLYTREEDEEILKYVLKGENIFRTTSISLWKALELHKGNPKRTYQSLKNRFLRNIKPKLFTTYREFIKDKETADRILSKFPELKRTWLDKQALINVSLPKRYSRLPQISGGRYSRLPQISGEVENRKPEFAGKKESEEHREKTSTHQKPSRVSVSKEPNVVVPRQGSQSLLSSPEVSPKKARKVVCKNETIVVTVTVSKEQPSRTQRKSKPVGIYQKYLKHKEKNVIIPCSECGRGGFDGHLSEDTDTDDEGRLVIASPLKTSMRENSSRADNSEEEDSAKKKSRKEGCSPSLLGGPPQVEEHPTQKVQAVNYYQEEKQENLQKLVTDLDLEDLYWNTISFCRTLTDCESGDEEKKELKKDLTGSCRSLRKRKPEFFFGNVEAKNPKAAEQDSEDYLLQGPSQVCEEQR